MASAPTFRPRSPRGSAGERKAFERVTAATGDRAALEALKDELAGVHLQCKRVERQCQRHAPTEHREARRARERIETLLAALEQRTAKPKTRAAKKKAEPAEEQQLWVSPKPAPSA